MNSSAAFRRYDYYILLAFAFTAVASIALQNLIWVSIALFLFLCFKHSEKINWPSNLFTTATLLFLATFLIGAIAGVNPAKSFETVHKYLTFLIIFPLGAMAFTITDIRKLLYFFTAGATVCAAYGIIYKHFVIHQDRIDSFSGDKMVFGGMLMASLLLILSFLTVRPKNYWFWVSLPLITVALLLTETRGAWLGALVGFTLLTWRLNKRWLFIGFILIVVGFFFSPKELQERVKSITTFNFSYGDKQQINNSSQTRFLIWIAGIQMIKAHPMGVGQGNVEDLYPQYRVPNNDSEQTVPHLHDNFLQILAQNGWLGLFAYLFWIFMFYFEAFRFKSSNAEARQWNWMFLSVFSAVLIWGLTEYTFSHQFMNIQFFLLGLQINLWKNYKNTNPLTT
jgi:O-antigen ligase